MGDLIVGGSSVTTAVVTEELLADSIRYSVVAGILEGWRDRALALRERVQGAAGAWSVATPVANVHSALRSCSSDARELADALLASADEYERAEQGAAAARFAERFAAGLLGAMAPGMVLSLLPVTLPLGSAIAASALVDPEATRAALAMLFAEHGRDVLADPAFVALVRSVADDTDEFLAGLLRNPGLLIDGADVDVPENAALVLAAAGLVALATGGSALVETPVRVQRAEPPSSAPASEVPDRATAPRGVGELAERVPFSLAEEPQIRIERYGGPEEPRWIVYSAGTADFGVTPATEPYDTTSNVHMVAASAGLPVVDGGGERAIRQAMDQAGVAPGDPILLVGHSGGGLAIANLAADPSRNVVAAVSLGGPVAQVDTGDVPLLSVEHVDDFVPATAGHGVAAPGRVVVERSVGELVQDDRAAVPAHALTAYRGTAEAIDASADERLHEFRARIAAFAGDGTAEVTYWRAIRDHGDRGGGGGGGGGGEGATG